MWRRNPVHTQICTPAAKTLLSTHHRSVDNITNSEEAIAAVFAIIPNKNNGRNEKKKYVHTRVVIIFILDRVLKQALSLGGV